MKDEIFLVVSEKKKKVYCGLLWSKRNAKFILLYVIFSLVTAVRVKTLPLLLLFQTILCKVKFQNVE